MQVRRTATQTVAGRLDATRAHIEACYFGCCCAPWIFRFPVCASPRTEYTHALFGCTDSSGCAGFCRIQSYRLRLYRLRPYRLRPCTEQAHTMQALRPSDSLDLEPPKKSVKDWPKASPKDRKRLFFQHVCIGLGRSHRHTMAHANTLVQQASSTLPASTCGAILSLIGPTSTLPRTQASMYHQSGRQGAKTPIV